jgi:YfiH family protein
MVLAKQVHGKNAAIVARGGPPMIGGPGADILATGEAGVFLVVLSADCATIALFDPVARAIAAVHAGWRGACAGAAGEAVRLLAARLGAEPARLFAAIGPAIGPCCYEVGNDVLAAARTRPGGAAAIFSDPRGAPGKGRLDLAALVRADLCAAGVRAESIEEARLCTRCRRDLFFSHRAGDTGRAGLAIGLTP